jgi:hypothetical protein
MVGARARDYYDREAKERRLANLKKGSAPDPVVPSDRETGDARDIAGKAVKVSGTSIDAATKVLKFGTPEQIAAVDQGKVKVTA